MNIVETIGYQGPYISLLITSVALLDQKKYLGSFILFYFVDYYIIGLLKQIIKEPRPKGYLDKEYDDGGNYDGIASYGMPSGHSAIVWYSTVFLWIVKQSPYLLIIELVICFNTMYQRWSYKKHSVVQIAVGMLVGGSIAWIAVLVTKRVLQRET
jgi:membrane-associated phospholipid phosphatase